MSDSFSERSTSVVFIPSIHEIYSTVRGHSEDFGIEGYRVSKKSDLLIIKEQSIAKAKKRDLYFDISKRSKEPSPFNYSPTYEKTKKDYWSPKNGRFEKAKKKTYIDEILKIHGPLPGPADYLSSEDSLSPKKTQPKFSYIPKSEEAGFLGNTISLAQESLSPSHYFPDEISRSKAFNYKEKRPSVFRYYSPNKPKIVEEKSIVGPGYLPNLEQSFLKESGKPKAPSVTFPKSKQPRIISQKFMCDKFIPGVGTYKNIDLAYSNHIVKQKSRSVFISKTSLNRYTEDAAKQKSWVPGPGSYNLIEDGNKKRK